MQEFEKMLIEGLKAGYAGGSSTNKIIRGNFEFKTSHLITKNGIYHDEWAADRAGGGQEIVKTKDDKTFTRIYAGGTIPTEKLDKLGITQKDVISYLRKKLTENTDETRLLKNFEPEADGNWKYKYTILDNQKDIPLTVGREVVEYKNKLVFIHILVLSPVD